MRTISIYSRPYINVESDGIIYACQIYGEDSDTPYFFFDGARYELKNEERHALEKVLGKEIWHGDDQTDPYCMHTP